MTSPLFGRMRDTAEFPAFQRGSILFLRRMAAIGVMVFGGIGARVYFLRDATRGLFTEGRTWLPLLVRQLRSIGVDSIPLVTIVFTDGAFGNVRRIQEESYGNRLIACDLTNPDFVRFAESFGAAAERVRTPDALRVTLRRAFARRDVPTVIEVPVGPFPSPWEFIMMPRVRGR